MRWTMTFPLETVAVAVTLPAVITAETPASVHLMPSGARYPDVLLVAHEQRLELTIRWFDHGPSGTLVIPL